MNFHRQAPDENVNLTIKSVSDTDGGSWDLQSLLSGESFPLAHGIDDDALGAALPPEPAGPSDEDASSRAPAYTPEMNRQLERWLQTLCDEPRLGQWEHFRLEEKLGDGGFGVVYRAQDMRADRTVALKVLRLKHTSDYSEGKKRFENEARGVLALRHPHVIRGFEAGVIAGRPYLSMELARCSLHDLLAQRGQLPWREAVELILQAARGLAELHDQSFIHRDLKPGNLLLMQDGRLKIADLGLVTAPQNEDSALAGPPTTMGRTVGTTDYMSPEQCLGSRVGVAADIYSLGMVLFRMIAGRRPDQGLRPRQRLFHRAWRGAPPLCSVAKDIPAALGRIVDRMLARYPEDRYASPQSLIDDLTSLLGDDQAQRRLARPWALTRRVWSLGASVTMVAALAGGTLVWNRAARQPSARSRPIDTGPPTNGWKVLQPVEGSTAILRDEEWILRNRGWLVSAAQFPRGVRVEFDWEWTEGEGTYSDILTVGLATSGRPGNKTWTREIQDGLRLLFAPHPAPGNIVIRDTKTEKQLARTWGPRLAKSNELHVRIDYYGEEVRIHLNHSDEPSLLGSVPREMTFQRVAIYNRERVAGIDKESRLRNLQLTPLPEPPT